MNARETNDGKRVSESQVLEAERGVIRKRREKTGRCGKELTGLALSGGGIRSAVFCLGAIQALAKYEILERFDYLSTVSGGGYLGSSLTWFTSQNFKEYGVSANKLPYGIDDPGGPPQAPRRATFWSGLWGARPQPAPAVSQVPGTPLLAYLRRHGSYLNPSGPLSALPGLAVVLRGILLNLLVWLPIFTALMVLARVGYRGSAYLLFHYGANPETSVFERLLQHCGCWSSWRGAVWLKPWMLPAALGCWFVAMAIVYSLFTGMRARLHKDTPYPYRRQFEERGARVLRSLGVLLIAASFPLIHLDQGWAASAMTVAGSVLGVWSRIFPTKTASNSVPSWIGPIGGSLFLYGFLLLAYDLSGAVFTGSQAWPSLTADLVVLAAIVAAGLLGFFTDLNEITLHRFYRDRLMEAFMPDFQAGTKKVPNFALPDRRKASLADQKPLCTMCDEHAKGPYHLINAHVVLTEFDGKASSKQNTLELKAAAQASEDKQRIRGGDSFVLAPLYSGSRSTGWYSTADNKALNKLSLPTAMAISGAAVNPGAASAGVGPTRSWSFAALMALLNMRLGYWLPNPAKFAGEEHARAPNHFSPGFSSILDMLGRNYRYLELADGGDFENLGVYELLRRKVRTIVVCDAGADPDTAFADLQNLLSRAEADFGATITFDPPPLGPLMSAPAPARYPLNVPFAKAPYVQAKITYESGLVGKLYYLKASIFEGLRLNLLGFKGAFPDFPQDTTANQFFSEARFEAYRQLGFAAVERMLENDTIKQVLLAM